MASTSNSASRLTPSSAPARFAEVGDILVRADGAPIASFAPLGRLLDASVGERVGLEVEDDHDKLPDDSRQVLDYLGWVQEELTLELSRSL